MRSTAPSPDGGSVDLEGDARTPNTLLNAVIGGVVGIVLSFIPFSTVLGGAVAGYLEGGDARAGMRIGALAGVVALVPVVLIGLVGLLFVIVDGGFRIVVLLFVFAAVATVYTVGFSALGGVLGVYLKNEL